MIRSLLRRWCFSRTTRLARRNTQLNVETLESREQPCDCGFDGGDFGFDGGDFGDAVSFATSDFGATDFGFNDTTFFDNPVPFQDPFLPGQTIVNNPFFVNDAFTSGQFDNAQLAVINQLIIANLQAVFAQPIPPGGPIVAAGITAIVDLNGDGFQDVSAVVIVKAGRGRLAAYSLHFNGLSPSSQLISSPTRFDPLATGLPI